MRFFVDLSIWFTFEFTLALPADFRPNHFAVCISVGEWEERERENLSVLCVDLVVSHTATGSHTIHRTTSALDADRKQLDIGILTLSRIVRDSPMRVSNMRIGVLFQ